MFNDFYGTNNETNLFSSPLFEPLFSNHEEEDEYNSIFKDDSSNDELKPDQYLNQLIDNQEKGEKRIKVDEKIIPEVKGSSTSSTTFNNKKRSNPTQKIFSITKQPKQTRHKIPAYWRYDGAIKYLKTNIIDFSFKRFKNLVKESDIPSEYKPKKIFLPSSTLFTAVDSMKANFKFLSKTVKEIFTIGKEKYPKQSENHQTLSELEDMLSTTFISENSNKLREFLGKTYEDLIKEFYQSKEFTAIKDSDIALFHDEGMIKQEKVSILEVNGFLKLINKKGAH